jgi:hypothetical protein
MAASTSAIMRRAVSTAVRWVEPSRRKIGWPASTRWLPVTITSATRPAVSGTMGTARKTALTEVVAGWK